MITATQHQQAKDLVRDVLDRYPNFSDTTKFLIILSRLYGELRMDISADEVETVLLAVRNDLRQEAAANDG